MFYFKLTIKIFDLVFLSGLEFNKHENKQQYK